MERKKKNLKSLDQLAARNKTRTKGWDLGFGKAGLRESAQQEATMGISKGKGRELKIRECLKLDKTAPGKGDSH